MVPRRVHARRGSLSMLLRGAICPRKRTLAMGISGEGYRSMWCYTAVMDDTDASRRDTSRHDATPYDPLRHTLTVHEVELQLSAAGVGRTPRTIQRLCENMVFDAARLGGNNEWFIAPDSVPKG